MGTLVPVSEKVTKVGDTVGIGSVSKISEFGNRKISLATVSTINDECFLGQKHFSCGYLNLSRKG